MPIMLLHIVSLILVSFCSGRPHEPRNVTTRLIYDLGPGTWIENIAVRSNGDLLLTSLAKPGYVTWLRDPRTSPQMQRIHGFDFPDTLGIVETQPDVFSVLSSNFSLDTVSAAPESNAIWEVDFSASYEGAPIAAKAVALPDAVFLNGLTASNSSLLLAADSALGVVWAIDLITGTSFIAADDPLMKPVSGQSYLEGINGLRFRPSKGKRERNLCFTNSQQYIFACLKLDINARAAGPASIVARPLPENGFSAINWDDFSFDKQGNAYIATEKGNSVQRVSPEGRVTQLAGDLNSTDIAQPTSTAFGRGHDRQTLYAVTAGGLTFPVINNGQALRTGAQVVAIDLSEAHDYL